VLLVAPRSLRPTHLLSLLYQSLYYLLRVTLSWLKSATRRRRRRRMTTLMRRRILKMIMLRRRKRRQGPLSLRQPRRLSAARSTFLAFNLHTLWKVLSL